MDANSLIDSAAGDPPLIRRRRQAGDLMVVAEEFTRGCSAVRLPPLNRTPASGCNCYPRRRAEHREDLGITYREVSEQVAREQIRHSEVGRRLNPEPAAIGCDLNAVAAIRLRA